MYKKMMAVALPALIFISCNNGAPEKETPKTDTAKHEMHTMTPPAPDKKFDGIAFANAKDFICGMPVTAGVEDTAHYKDKVYGFCAKECKDEFLKSPEQYLTVKK